jgi:molybdenum cofactor cytidylyltransferase
MRRNFEGVECPATADGLASVIEEAFEELTGFPISHADYIYVEKYSHGGMSSGYVDPKFWRETAVPLLQSRLLAQRSEDT